MLKEYETERSKNLKRVSLRISSNDILIGCQMILKLISHKFYRIVLIKMRNLLF